MEMSARSETTSPGPEEHVNSIIPKHSSEPLYAVMLKTQDTGSRGSHTSCFLFDDMLDVERLLNGVAKLSEEVEEFSLAKVTIIPTVRAVASRLIIEQDPQERL